MSKIVDELEATLRGGQTPNENLTRRVIRELNRKQAEIVNAHKDKRECIDYHAKASRMAENEAVHTVIASIDLLTNNKKTALPDTLRQIAHIADSVDGYGRSLIGSRLRRYANEIETSKKCPDCGALIPEDEE